MGRDGRRERGKHDQQLQGKRKKGKGRTSPTTTAQLHQLRCPTCPRLRQDLRAKPSLLCPRWVVRQGSGFNRLVQYSLDRRHCHDALLVFVIIRSRRSETRRLTRRRVDVGGLGGRRLVGSLEIRARCSRRVCWRNGERRRWIGDRRRRLREEGKVEDVGRRVGGNGECRVALSGGGWIWWYW
jgi:hypothetical protein